MHQRIILFVFFLPLIGIGHELFTRNAESSFFSEFSIQRLVKNNNSPSGLLCAKRGMGGVTMGLQDRNQDAVRKKSESFSCVVKSSEADKFDEADFIASLKADVEESIKKSGLRIKNTNHQSSSGFRSEYENETVSGEIILEGEMKKGQYQLRASLIEKGNQKTGQEK